MRPIQILSGPFARNGLAPQGSLLGDDARPTQATPSGGTSGGLRSPGSHPLRHSTPEVWCLEKRQTAHLTIGLVLLDGSLDNRWKKTSNHAVGSLTGETEGRPPGGAGVGSLTRAWATEASPPLRLKPLPFETSKGPFLLNCLVYFLPRTPGHLRGVLTRHIFCTRPAR